MVRLKNWRKSPFLYQCVSYHWRFCSSVLHITVQLTARNIFFTNLQGWMEISFGTFLCWYFCSVLVADDIFRFPEFSRERLFAIEITDTAGQSVRTRHTGAVASWAQILVILTWKHLNIHEYQNGKFTRARFYYWLLLQHFFFSHCNIYLYALILLTLQHP